MYRNKKLRESARDESCVNCGAMDGTVVYAHSNELRHGKGKGIKCHDVFGAYLCHRCHHEYDQGTKLTREQKRTLFREWWEETLIRACEKENI